MSREVDTVRLEVVETLAKIAKERQPEYQRALDLSNQGYRATSGAWDWDCDSLPFSSQWWEIQFPDGTRDEWSLYLENMPQYVWDKLDPSGELNATKVFGFLKEIG